MMDKAIFASGCFWCSEAIFKRLKGVKSAISGYTGGDIDNPSYQDVCSGKTGHAEAIQIEFDTNIISFETLLDVFWHTHNPTTLNRQGNDVGTQYRSAIFYQNELQKEIAEKSKANLESLNYYDNKIVTEIVPFTKFFEAEEYHMDFYDRNRTQSYCSIIIDPKIKKLMQEYKNILKD